MPPPFFLPPRFPPQVHPQGCTLHSDVCHIISQTKTHNSLFNRTNYCGAKPDCCCHGNCLSGGYGATKAQVSESERKWAEVRGRLRRRHTLLIVCQHISCFILFHGVYYWQFTLTLNDLTTVLLRVNARKWIWSGWVGISVLSALSRVPRGPRAETHSPPFIHCIKWMYWVQGGVSEI